MGDAERHDGGSTSFTMIFLLWASSGALASSRGKFGSCAKIRISEDRSIAA
jgi:hypothetical protein